MKNRTKIISSILFWVLVLLVSILLINTLSRSTFDWSFSFSDNDERNLIQEQTLRQSIDTLDVDWTSGSVTIEGTNQSTIEIKEYANKQLKDNEQASIDVNGNTLTIKSNIHSTFNFVFWQSPRSHLHVLIPYDMLEELDIKHTSGRLQVEDLELNSINIRFTSGIANFSNTQSESISINMTSGSMNFDEVISEKLDISLTSGSVNADKMIIDEMVTTMTSGLINIEFVDNPPSVIDAKINAGNATIDLPENSDFTLTSNITSGNLNANFDHTTDGNRKIHKNGRDSYIFKITSGNVTINTP